MQRIEIKLMKTCSDYGKQCMYRDDFFDGLRCIRCTRPKFNIEQETVIQENFDDD